MTFTIGEERWGYADGRETEAWSGACETREEAIEEARVELCDGAEIWIVRGKVPDPAG